MSVAGAQPAATRRQATNAGYVLTPQCLRFAGNLVVPAFRQDSVFAGAGVLQSTDGHAQHCQVGWMISVALRISPGFAKCACARCIGHPHYPTNNIPTAYSTLTKGRRSGGHVGPVFPLLDPAPAIQLVSKPAPKHLSSAKHTPRRVQLERAWRTSQPSTAPNWNPFSGERARPPRAPPDAPYAPPRCQTVGHTCTCVVVHV